MKIAFVHDWIVHEGGAEAVLRDLIETHTYDEGKVFVLFSTAKQFELGEKKDSSASPLNDLDTLEIITALPRWLNSIFVYFNTNKIPGLSKIFDYRNLMFWFPLLCRLLRKKIERYGASEIIISSFAAVKNIQRPVSLHNKYKESQHKQQSDELINENTKFSNTGSMKGEVVINKLDNTHKGSIERPVSVTLYLHSPMQYIWENYEENISKLKFPIKQLYQYAATYLRPRDKKERHYDVVLCNSHYTAELAKQLYGLEGKVQYPAINKAFSDELVIDFPKEYFVFVGRVQRYVREIDSVICMCNESKTYLIVIGSGPDIEYAKSLAGPTILFVGHISDVEEKIEIMKYARGLINLAKESFGIATAEALSLGVPVLGYNAGATPELIDETNGMLVDTKSSEVLHKALERFLMKDFDRKKISEGARKRFFG